MRLTSTVRMRQLLRMGLLLLLLQLHVLLLLLLARTPSPLPLAVRPTSVALALPPSCCWPSFHSVRLLQLADAAAAVMLLRRLLHGLHANPRRRGVWYMRLRPASVAGLEGVRTSLLLLLLLLLLLWRQRWWCANPTTTTTTRSCSEPPPRLYRLVLHSCRCSMLAHCRIVGHSRQLLLLLRLLLQLQRLLMWLTCRCHCCIRSGHGL